MTVHQRVLYLEKHVGIEYDPSTLLIRRIESLETNIYGESKNTDEAIQARIDNLEASLFDK